MARTHNGFLLIADITGYTQYLSESELEHAQETLTALLQVLVQHTQPPLVLSRLAGDAVISYALKASFAHGQAFVEMVEAGYTAFRRAIERMVMNNTCRCAACANVGSLDLKFFVHFGNFGIQRIDNHDELVGSDVNRIHRLLKNRVAEETGLRAYALYTDPAIRALGLGEWRASLRPHMERHEHLGEINCWLQDLSPVWQARRDEAQVSIPPDHILLTVAAEVAVSPAQLWSYLIELEFRNILLGSKRQAIRNLSDGRITAGSVYQCYHGNSVTPETILEWRPFERLVTHDVVPIPIAGTTMLIEYRLEPRGDATRLEQRFSKASGKWLGRTMCDIFVRSTGKKSAQDMANFKRAVEEAVSEQDD